MSLLRSFDANGWVTGKAFKTFKINAAANPGLGDFDFGTWPNLQ